MKQNKRLLGFAASVMLMAMSYVLAACSSDNDEKKTGDGARQVAELQALLLDGNGQVYFDATDAPGVYQIGLESKDDAQSLVRLYAGSGFTGQAYTRILDDGKGSVAVSIGDNGVFYAVRFAVTGIPQFTLLLADATGGGNAFGINHTCSVCGYTWRSTFNRCPREGNKTYHP